MDFREHKSNQSNRMLSCDKWGLCHVTIPEMVKGLQIKIHVVTHRRSILKRGRGLLLPNSSLPEREANNGGTLEVERGHKLVTQNWTTSYSSILLYSSSCLWTLLTLRNTGNNVWEYGVADTFWVLPPPSFVNLETCLKFLSPVSPPN